MTSLVRVDVAQRAAGAQKQDVYKHWLFDPLFKEDGLVMDSETSLPDVYSYNLVCLPSRRRLQDVLLSEIFILHQLCEALVFQCSLIKIMCLYVFVILLQTSVKARFRRTDLHRSLQMVSDFTSPTRLSFREFILDLT